ncbi:MAG TPA: hypothetical protein PKA84_01375 [Rubrivivax sp.]|nr:hypothetical protein [Rubrivivax sp.]HMR68860.1 hypothetical protein [Rubrivivax sp.]
MTRPATTVDDYVSAVRAAGSAGMDTRQLADRMCASLNWAAIVIMRAVHSGEVVKIRGRGRQASMYYAAEFDPPRAAPRAPPRPKGPTRAQMPAGSERSLAKLRPHGTLAATAEPIVPPWVRVQDCPSGRDQRFSVQTLQAGYRSQIDASESRPWAAAVAQACCSRKARA